MKRNKRSMISILLLAMVLMISACGSSNSNSGNSGSTADSGSSSSSDLSVLYFVNATLGDKSFYDSAQAGLDRAVKDFGIKAKTIEGGVNQADWASSLEAAVSTGKYNVVILGTSQMAEITKELATQYPDIQFIFFDDLLDTNENIYSMLYAQSEGAFLAGAFAALATTSTELSNANADKKIGFIGGMDIPIINDFLSGYKQGAAYVDPSVEVVPSYVGDFTSAPKAKELALSQINTQNVDIIFNVASGAGLGTLEGANEKGIYSIGVDSNQNSLYPGSVLTSMLKNVDNTVYRAIDLLIKGELPASGEVLGMKEDAVGLAKDELYDQYVPQSIKDKMKEIEQKLANGEIEVKSDLY
ncbi:Membrane lipoprotein TpN38(b) precursor [compost metagenome]